MSDEQPTTGRTAHTFKIIYPDHTFTEVRAVDAGTTGDKGSGMGLWGAVNAETGAITPGLIAFIPAASGAIVVRTDQITPSTLTPPPYAPGQRLDLVRQDMIDAYAEKWGTTPDYAAGMMEHVEQCAYPNAYPDTNQESTP